jgi:hypothetical protein
MPIEALLIPELPLIPIWFYSYSAVVYFLAAIISFTTSFFAFKLYKMSSVKMNLLLLFSFLTLGIAFSALTLTSVYTYFYKPYFEAFYDLSMINNLGFSFYYFTSLVAYLLFLTMYLPKKFTRKFLVLYVPLWYIQLTNFHIISILLLIYVVIKNIANFSKKRNLDSFLVMFAFITMIMFHSLLLLTHFDVELYLFAHVIITVGFASFLTMLIRVSKR